MYTRKIITIATAETMINSGNIINEAKTVPLI